MARLEQRVARDDLVAPGERGEVRLVGDVERHRQGADREADEEGLPDREDVECAWLCRDRTRAGESTIPGQ
jgi:hypothetical protein